jgi:CP family cyanate transporter-like MFS transporter
VRRTPIALLAGLFLAALAFRPQLIGVGPLIPDIQDDLGVTHAVAGLLGTIPVLCMGLFAPPAPFLSGRIGSRAAIAVAVGLVGVVGIARALVPGAAGVILLTIPIGVGMGLGGALMPVAVKERVAHRPAFATGVYAAGLNLGGGAASALAVPIADATWGWRGALFVFSALTALLPLAWLALEPRDPSSRRLSTRPLPLPWRSRLAWRLGAIFFLMSTAYYGINSWFPDVFQEHGWSKASAGALLGLVGISQLASTLAVPWLADRTGSRRLYLTGFGGIVAFGLVGVILAPGAGWLWALVIGVGFGTLFPLLMTLPLDVGRSPAEVGAVTGLMLGVGYSCSSVSPFLLGAVRDATGSFTDSLWLLVGVTATFVAMCAALSTERLRTRVIREQPAAR